MSTLRSVVLAAILLLGIGAAVVIQGDRDGDERPPAPETAQAETPVSPPRRHFRVGDAAELSPDEAEAIYRDIAEDMAAAYALSNHPAAADYQRWRRFNSAPYLSAAHGRRYLNNYGNAAAAAYGRYEEAGVLPEGAIVAKDSFTVTEDGTVAPGALFLMEKMVAGFNYVTGNWRFSVIMPDGSLLGETRGHNAQQVDYCVPCHLAVEDTDYMHFVPEAYRVAE